MFVFWCVCCFGFGLVGLLVLDWWVCWLFGFVGWVGCLVVCLLVDWIAMLRLFLIGLVGLGLGVVLFDLFWWLLWVVVLGC